MDNNEWKIKLVKDWEIRNDWKVRAAAEIDDLLKGAVIKNTGIKTGFFSSVSIQDIVNIIDMNHKDNIIKIYNDIEQFICKWLHFFENKIKSTDLDFIEEEIEKSHDRYRNDPQFRIWVGLLSNNIMEILKKG